jgi:hypothetical protein
MLTAGDHHALASLAESLASHASVLAQHNALARAALPQTYSGPMLRERYPGLGESTVLALVSTVTGRVGERGHRIALTLDQVLDLDAKVRDHVLAMQGAA